MQSPRMYGVVLWSSNEDGRAVIWCEDHGNLAYYSQHGGNMHCGVNLDAGDLIEFDLDDASEHRKAHNPRLLVEDAAPALADGLRSENKPQAQASHVDDMDNVVRFPGRRADNGRQSLAIA